MKLSRAWVWASLLLVLQSGGCDIAHSVNPFYFQENVIVDPSIVGEWQDSDSSRVSSLTIRPLSTDNYAFAFMVLDKDTKRKTTMEFEAHLFRFQNENYVDILPRKFQVAGKNEEYVSSDDDLEFYAPVHSALRLVREKDDLSLLFSVDASPVFAKEDEQTKKAREEEDQRKRIAILTMSTEQLQREVLPSFPADKASATLSTTFHRGK